MRRFGTGELTIDRVAEGRFLFGRLRWLSGANTGISTVIWGAEGAVVRLRELAPHDIAVGAWIELREGCDKTIATCATRFANVANFRGEPHVPGNDLLTRYPGA
ncbi:MAG: phage BR0599 family protein [Sphingomicrobium sp.]